MTIEELRQKDVGVLEKRSFSIEHEGIEREEDYYLMKFRKNWYLVTFSEDGNYCSDRVSEQLMLLFLNNVEDSNVWALNIYIRDPHLSSWMD